MPVHAEARGAVLEVTLDRPKANAIDRAASIELYEQFARLRDDDDLRVGLLTGAGERFFSAGWDLKGAAAGEETPDTDFGPGGFAGLTEMFDLEKPVIGAVNGMAVGGGFELLLACDLLVAAEHVELFLPELSRGIVPDAGAMQRLHRLVPRNVALDLMLTSRRLSAAEAQRLGLVRSVVPSERLMDEARAVADTVARAGPLATRATKQVLRGTEGMNAEAAFAAIRAGRFPAYARALASGEAAEGARAFAEGRPPSFP